MKKQTEDVSLPAFWDTAGGMLVVCVFASKTSYGSAFFIPLKKNYFFYLFESERENDWEGWRRESEAEFTLSLEPDLGFDARIMI